MQNWNNVAAAIDNGTETPEVGLNELPAKLLSRILRRIECVGSVDVFG